ncbi:sensor histidine kinase [Nonomuraea sediminis]|uniref:sensor histidine kinase n=1 Tax=Nonomuraea sediminis TaxID=2835864 RepID=UPI001BDD9561|nr:histidine kinase [Nonomuraea sediminis]
MRRTTPRQTVNDVILWILLSICAAATGPDPFTDPAGFAATTLPRIALAAVAVLVGRPWPLAAVLLLLPLGPWNFAEGLATTNLTWPVRLPEVKLFPLNAPSLFVIWYAYLTGRRMARTWPALAAFCVIAVTGAGVVLYRGGGLASWITLVSALVGAYAVPYLLGVLRRRLLQQREQNRLSVEAQARLRERARIARDMHDSLGHDLALIAVRAAGLELSPGLDESQVRAAGQLREAASDATERLRQIIGLLSEGPAPLTPPDEDVRALVERARGSGMSIALEVTEPVPALAHGVVQEALTNVAKHAPGAPVTVEIAPRRIAIRNGPPTRRPGRPGGGLGLAGLRERVRLAGGTLAAGPAEGGYALTVELPDDLP